MCLSHTQAHCWPIAQAACGTTDLSQEPDSEELLLWPLLADLTYVQTDSDPTYPGKVSVGFLFGAALLWPALEGVLQKEVVQGGVTSVTVAGHSLGAAVGTLLSYQAQVGAGLANHAQEQQTATVQPVNCHARGRMSHFREVLEV